MTRSFSQASVPYDIITHCVSLAAMSPSAGKSQGWNLVMLEGAESSRYWNITFPEDKRQGFAFPGLFNAPLIFLVIADPRAYLARYSEDDKSSTGLGDSTDAWVAPYWTIDASFATMTFLLALHDAGLGALFFAHSSESELRREFAIPDEVHILGTLAVGYEADIPAREGRSAKRATRSADSVIHRGRWLPDAP